MAACTGSPGSATIGLPSAVATAGAPSPDAEAAGVAGTRTSTGASPVAGCPPAPAAGYCR
ncbi:hypothetical protein [Streptomyces sp. NPDC005302]|uniref:hypothetical protein n=1 Tax=Streptomyces sp. NPDC005302 TaxID=3154675 RepID=UPI0033B9C308